MENVFDSDLKKNACLDRSASLIKKLRFSKPRIFHITAVLMKTLIYPARSPFLIKKEAWKN